jgi:hypothetical protein
LEWLRRKSSRESNHKPSSKINQAILKIDRQNKRRIEQGFLLALT